MSIFPKGKYNGRPITGVEGGFRIDLSTWYWRPRHNWPDTFGAPYLCWLCFRVEFSLVYNWSDRP